MMIYILIVLCFVDTFVKYQTRVENKLLNIVILAIGILLVFLIKQLFIKKNVKIIFSNQQYKRILLFGTIVLLSLQIFLIYQIYFYAGWDCRIVTIASDAIAKNNLVGTTKLYMDNYYSMYPNNLAITFVFSHLLSLFYKMGITNGYFALICVGVCIIDITALMVARITRRMIGSYNYGILAWVLYSLYIGMSPWIVVPYSDVYGIIFPVLIVLIYQSIEERKEETNILRWLFLALTMGIGVLVKPTVAIVFIAIGLVYIINVFLKKISIKRFVIIILTISTGFGISIGCKNIVQRDMMQYITIDSEKSMGMPHFMMMGLNTIHTGCYLKEDKEFSLSYSTKKQRNQANLREMGRRFQNFGVVGYGKFFIKKTLVNYNSGILGWGSEGQFIDRKSAHKTGNFTMFLRNIYYMEGQYFGVYATMCQFTWLFILVSMLFAVKYKGATSEINLYHVFLLTVIGITMFTLLFEARARYLYIYVPLYIILSCVGVRQYCMNIKERVGKSE